MGMDPVVIKKAAYIVLMKEEMLDRGLEGEHMIRKTDVRAFVKEKGYRLSGDALPALEEAVRMILTRAIFYTRPAKTIRGKEILMAAGKKENLSR